MDPSVPVVYAGFGALMLTSAISYLSHAQVNSSSYECMQTMCVHTASSTLIPNIHHCYFEWFLKELHSSVLVILFK